MSEEKLSLYTQVIKDLHEKWEPHEGQIQIGRSLFNEDVRQIFVQCGRKFGKTEVCIYMLWRWALLNPGSSCYYISPYLKQSKEIVWANKRIQTFGPQKYIDSINNTELRLNFKNGSFIKCDGSDNYEAFRGITPHFVLYDEFKDFRPEFHVAMEPNLIVMNAPIVMIGTPPDKEGQYTQIASEFSNHSTKRFFQMPTWVNPHIPKSWLMDQKKLYESRGEQAIWAREYEGRFVPGGANAIFPMLSRKYVKLHEEVLKEIEYDRKKLKWYVIADPGTTTCFAVLFACINPYNKKIYLLDEIYETNQKYTSVTAIGAKVKEKKEGLNVRYEWLQYADEAAAWFRKEMFDRFEESYGPTQKSLKKKDEGLSLIKDTFIKDKIVISSNCKKLYWEMENYVSDQDGNIPKVNDHLIDCFRYLLTQDFYTLENESEPGPESETRRGFKISDDFKGLDKWGRRLDQWYDEDIEVD